MSAQPMPKLLSTEEYLARERRAEFKSEYYKGETFAMAGASRPHNRIVTNVSRLLDTQLLKRECNVYSSDMRVRIPQIQKYTYPDVVVTCGKESYEDAEVDSLLNPILIVEILSASTEAYDRGRKFQHYQFLASLREYVLITQDAIRVEQYVRQNNKTWTYIEYQNLDDVIKLESVECDLPLREVYLKVSELDESASKE